MARYEHLPIFADSYRLALLIEQQVAGFPNRLRPGLGSGQGFNRLDHV